MRIYASYHSTLTLGSGNDPNKRTVFGTCTVNEASLPYV
jgi:hypothetical protein